MAGLTVNSNLSPHVQAYYDKRFLLRAKPELVAYQFAQKRELPNGVGGTVYFSRVMPLSKVKTPLTETPDGGLTLATRQQLKTEEISATAAFWGDYVAISKMASVVSINSALTEKVDLISQQAGESIDYYVMKKMAQGLNRRRADGDTNYQKEYVADATSTASQIVVTGVNDGNKWTGGYVIVSEGTNYGMARRVSSSADNGADTVINLASPFPKPCDATTKFRVVVNTDIVDTDVITTSNIRLAIRDLKRAKAMNYERGYFVCIIDPDVEYDFMSDTTWQQAAIYKDQVDALYTGEIGRWLGIRFVGASQLFREALNGDEDEAGDVHLAAILGKEAYGVVELAGQQRKIYTMTPEQLGQPIPMYSTVGWQVGFEATPLNSMFGICLLCGASK